MHTQTQTYTHSQEIENKRNTDMENSSFLIMLLCHERNLFHCRIQKLLLEGKAKWIKMLVTQSCPTFWDLMVCSPLGFSVHGVLPARILEWVAIPFSWGPSQPRDQARVSCTAGGLFTFEPPWVEAPIYLALKCLNFKGLKLVISVL